jgi:hypothetical protein
MGSVLSDSVEKAHARVYCHCTSAIYTLLDQSCRLVIFQSVMALVCTDNQHCSVIAIYSESKCVNVYLLEANRNSIDSQVFKFPSKFGDVFFI